MKSRPKVFISASSSEFRPWRRVATEELLRMECEPVAMDYFSTTAGKLVSILDGLIGECDAVICLIGHDYGEPVPGNPKNRSYTQLEYDLAIQHGMEPFLLLSTEPPSPSRPPHDLQMAFRAEVRNSGRIWHTFSSEDEFRRHILGMRFKPRRRASSDAAHGEARSATLSRLAVALVPLALITAGWLAWKAQAEKLDETNKNGETIEPGSEPRPEGEYASEPEKYPDDPGTVGRRVGQPDDLWNKADPKPGELGMVNLGNFSQEFSWCPPGKFQVGFGHGEPGADGAVDRKESPPREIPMEHGFWMARHELSVAQWRGCVLDGFSPEKPFENSGMAGNLPVAGVSWIQATELCAWLQSQVPAEWAVRLPYEVEWEYACRAGEFGQPFWFGSVLDGRQGNCDGRQYPFDGTKRQGQGEPGSSAGGPVAVDAYNANRWGIYNTHGNVREWCRDYYAKIYTDQQSPGIFPRGPDSGEERVLRGGYWASRARSCRSAAREGARPNLPVDGAGIRLVIQKNPRPDL